MLGFIAWWRRRRALREPFPERWREVLRADVPFYDALSPGDIARFEDKLKVFVRTKTFTGAGGFEVNDRARVVVAAAAARLTMNLPAQHYGRLREIVIYPGDYRHPDQPNDVAVFGEANRFGTLILSWDAVLGGLRNEGDGHDTASHELAHALDIEDGHFDGTPLLSRFGAYGPWARVMSKEFLALRKGRGKGRQVLRAYGATNEAEFFAVATESFFEKPRQMLARHPALYAALAEYYGADPAGAAAKGGQAA